MAFAYSGGIITQTGTNTNLSGLSGLTGVTVKTVGGLKIYDIGPNKLFVKGTLSIDGLSDCLESSASSDALSAQNSGTLNLGVQKTGSDGYVYFEPTVCFISTANPPTWWQPGVKSYGNGALSCVSGGTLNWNKAVVYLKNGNTANGFSFEDGTVNINNGVIISGKGSALTGREIISGIHSSNVSINGLAMIGGELIIGADSSGATITGLSRENSAIAIFPNRISNITFEDANVGGKGNVVDVCVQTEGVSHTHTKMLNCVTGNNLKIVGAESGNDPRNQGTVRIQKKLSLTALDTSGQGISNAKLYIKDTNNGQRKNLNGLDDTADKIYQSTSPASGTFSTQIIDTAIVNVDGANARGTSNTGAYRIDFRGKNDSTLQSPNIPANTAEFDFITASYLHNVTKGSVLLLGAGILYQNVTMLFDLNVTEAKSVVDAYPVSIGVSGNTITVTGDNSTVQNLTAAQLYDVLKVYFVNNLGVFTNLLATRSGNEINAAGYNVNLSYISFTGDMVTDQIISLSNGSVFNGTRTDANGTVFPDSVLTLTGLQPNSEVRVYQAGTTTEIAGIESSGTTFSAITSETSVDIVVHSLGYEYQRIEGADTSSNLTLPIQQRVDRNYRNP